MTVSSEHLAEGALSGIKVADFTHITAGYLTTKTLADYGAIVVLVESTNAIIGRVIGPYYRNTPGVNRCGPFAYQNANKYGIAIDLKRPAGLGLAKRLVSWADVVVENFSAGTMETLGLGYDDLRAVKPDIVMLRLSAQGQTGPLRRSRAFGTQLSGLFGIAHFIGWPNQDPIPPQFAYSDYFVPFFAVAALGAALEHRRRTGRGMMVDVSQAEVCAQFLAPYLLEYSVNGQESCRNANRHYYAVPHNVYRCQGEDRWSTIAVFTDSEWVAFCGVLGNPPWTREARLATFANRKEHEEELDDLIARWTITRSAEEVVALMQAAGVRSEIVQTGKDVYEDPQLRWRNFLWRLPHSEMGDFVHMGQPATMSATPPRPFLPAPCLGEHSEYVCTQLLGMSDEEFIRLAEEGVLE